MCKRMGRGAGAEGRPERGQHSSSSVPADQPAAAAGNFRAANPTLSNQFPEASIPMGRGPAATGALELLGNSPTGAVRLSAAAKPPPVTQPRRQVIASASSAVAEFDVSVQIVADQLNATTVAANGARTDVVPESGLQRPTQLRWGSRNGRIASISQKLIVRGSFVICTSYGADAQASERSLYGRGTTSEDIQNGDISLGFHEWCHQQEYFSYLVSTGFPEFSGQLGDSVDSFRAALNEFSAAYRSFMAGIRALGPAVDEVGKTRRSVEQMAVVDPHRYSGCGAPRTYPPGRCRRSAWKQ